MWYGASSEIYGGGVYQRRKKTVRCCDDDLREIWGSCFGDGEDSIRLGCRPSTTFLLL